jgi:hypothetical protein
MAKVKYDVTGSDPEKAVQGPQRKSPRPGMYSLRLKSWNRIHPKDRSTGRPDTDRWMWELIFEVLKADKAKNNQYKGSQLWEYVLEEDDSHEWKRDQVLQAFGVAGQKSKRKGSFDTDDYVGTNVLGVVRAGKNQDGDYRGELAQILAFDEEAFASAIEEAKKAGDDEDDTSADDGALEVIEDSEDEEGQDLDTIGESADEGDAEAIEYLTGLAGEAELDPDEYPTWAELATALADLEPEASEEETEAEPEAEETGEAVDLDALGAAGDEGEEEAIEKLTELAGSADVDPDDFPTWAEEVEEEPDEPPSKGKKSAAKSPAKSGTKTASRTRAKKGEDGFPF